MRKRIIARVQNGQASPAGLGLAIVGDQHASAICRF